MTSGISKSSLARAEILSKLHAYLYSYSVYFCLLVIIIRYSILLVIQTLFIAVQVKFNRLKHLHKLLSKINKYLGNLIMQLHIDRGCLSRIAISTMFCHPQMFLCKAVQVCRYESLCITSCRYHSPIIGAHHTWFCLRSAEV